MDSQKELPSLNQQLHHVEGLRVLQKILSLGEVWIFSGLHSIYTLLLVFIAYSLKFEL